MPPTTRPPRERFWPRVDNSGGPDACWPWTGAASKRMGHGIITRGGRGGGFVSATRVSWEIHHGPIPDGLIVMHVCDNPPCVNPTHLRLGTHADNSADMKSKARQSFGERRYNARLTDDAVRDIRRRAASGESSYSISAIYGVDPAHIRGVVRRKFWAHVE